MAITIVAACLPMSTAHPDATEPSVRGTLNFSQLAVDGRSDTSFSSPTLALIRAGDSEGPSGSVHWTLRADALVVNWTRAREFGLGSSQGNPNASFVAVPMETMQEEARFTGAVASGALVSPRAHMLMQGLESASALATLSTGRLLVEPSQTGSWVAGLQFESTPPPARNSSMTRVHNFTSGLPFMSSSNPLDLAYRGDVVLYIWGDVGNPDVTVEGDDGAARSYHTGYWWENATGSAAGGRGVTRDDYAQVLELRATNASFALSQERGNTAMVLSSASIRASQTMSFSRTDAYVEGAGYYYAVHGGPLKVSGPVTLRVRASNASTSVLHGTLEAEDATLSVPPSGPLSSPVPDAPTAPVSPDAPIAAQGAGTFSSAVTTNVTIAFAVAVALLAAALALAYRSSRGRRVPDETAPEHAEAAEAALMRHDYKAARREAHQYLAKHPDDVDAWFVYGVSLVKEGNYGKTVRDLEPVTRTIRGERAGLGYLLAYSFVKLGEPNNASKWLEVAM